MRTLATLFLAAAFLFGIRYILPAPAMAPHGGPGIPLTYALRPEHAESTVGLEELEGNLTHTTPQQTEGSSSDAGLEEDEKKVSGPRMSRRRFFRAGGGVPALIPPAPPAPQAVSAPEILAKNPDVAQVYYRVIELLTKVKEALAEPPSNAQDPFALMNLWKLLGDLAKALELWQEKMSPMGEKKEWAPVLSEMSSAVAAYRLNADSFGDRIPDPSLAGQTREILASATTGTFEMFRDMLIRQIQRHFLDRNRRRLEEAAVECARYGTRLDLSEGRPLEDPAFEDASWIVGRVLDTDPTLDAPYAGYDRIAHENHFSWLISASVHQAVYGRYQQLLISAVRKAADGFYPPQDPTETPFDPSPPRYLPVYHPYASFRERPQGFAKRVFVSERKRRLSDFAGGRKEPENRTPEERRLAHVIQEMPPRVLIRTRDPYGFFKKLKDWLDSRPPPAVSSKVDQRLPPASSPEEPLSVSEELPEGPLPFLWPGKGTHLLREKFLLFAPETWSEAIAGLFNEEQRQLVQVEPLEKLADAPPVDSSAIVLLDADGTSPDLPAQHPLVLQLRLSELSSLTPDLLSYLASQAKLRNRLLIWTTDSARSVTFDFREYLLLWESA